MNTNERLNDLSIKTGSEVRYFRYKDGRQNRNQRWALDPSGAIWSHHRIYSAPAWNFAGRNDEHNIDQSADLEEFTPTDFILKPNA